MSATGESLAAEIEAQGVVVRDLKKGGASKEALAPEVEKLLALKAKYEEVTGQKYGGEEAKGGDKKKGGKDKATPASSSSDKKAEKEPKAEKAPKEKKAEKAEKPADAPAEEKKAPVEKSETFSFPQTEEEILKYWDQIDAFNTSLKLSEGRPEYTFYDGPPFATGQPHHGHILAGTIKDVMCRYAHQTGHYVERRFGWDCHGLPVEYEIDKSLNIRTPDDVKKMGIENYNSECRKIVMRYSSDWRRVVRRLGRWIDFDNDYKTMYPWFMESVWWVFKQLFEKGLVYRGYTVMPFSTALATPLSNFEATQNMKEDVEDPSVTVLFKLKEEENTYALAWTTTPWTLPSNLALCVHPELVYCRVKEVSTGRILYAAESRLVGKGCLFKEESMVEILDKMPGSALVGKRYEPLFPYFASRTGDAFRIISDTYVADDSGTGIVHQAPAHGEDDYRIALAQGIITNENIPCPVDDSGRFTDEVPEFKGVYIKDADKGIMRMLKEQGKLFHQGTLKHTYPFCWRSDTPLIRKTVDSWFIRVTDFKDKLIHNNKQTYWVPSAIQHGRFHNWLADARDWAVSRNRYWGTPMPLWVSEDGKEVVCIGSIEELERLSGVKGIKDLHRENIDQITIPSQQGKGVLRRITQVFDCWFESGSMPYAQKHYPFENKERFEGTFPADFIAEGVDQTRGWFYTLLVISTALFDKPPFRNLIVNGLVLAKDGKKMSKRLKNYTPPEDIIQSDGSDVLRLYLINSPAVRAENLKFDDDDMKALVRDVFLPWLNAYRFFEQNAQRLSDATKQPFLFDDSALCPTDNVFDKWILTYTQTLINFMHEEMLAYRLYTVVPRLLRFIDNLTNWYVRFNRKRLKGGNGDDDARVALSTLGEVLLTLTKAMSPFTPFFAEWVYQKMRGYLKGGAVKSPNTWSVSEVSAWLNTNKLASYTELFASNGISGVDLLDMTHEDLMSMGLARCSDRKAVLRETQKLNHAQSVKVTGNEVTEDASVHFQMLPRPKEGYYNIVIERQFEVLRRVIETARIIRDRNTLPVKYPLREIVVISKEGSVLGDIAALQDYVLGELNIQKLTTSHDETTYNVQLKAEADQKNLGARLKGDMDKVKKAVAELSQDALKNFQASGSMEVVGHVLSSHDVKLSYVVAPGESSTYSAEVDANILVLIDVTPTPEMLDEGVAREFVSRVQKLRKKGKLNPKDAITVYYEVSADDASTNLARAVSSNMEYIVSSLDGHPVLQGWNSSKIALVDEVTKIKTAELKLWLEKM